MRESKDRVHFWKAILRLANMSPNPLKVSLGIGFKFPNRNCLWPGKAWRGSQIGMFLPKFSEDSFRRRIRVSSVFIGARDCRKINFPVFNEGLNVQRSPRSIGDRTIDVIMVLELLAEIGVISFDFLIWAGALNRPELIALSIVLGENFPPPLKAPAGFEKGLSLITSFLGDKIRFHIIGPQD